MIGFVCLHLCMRTHFFKRFQASCMHDCKCVCKYVRRVVGSPPRIPKTIPSLAIACGTSAWNSDRVSVLCQRSLWVVVDLKRHYRSSLNECSNVCKCVCVCVYVGLYVFMYVCWTSLTIHWPSAGPALQSVNCCCKCIEGNVIVFKFGFGIQPSPTGYGRSLVWRQSLVIYPYRAAQYLFNPRSGRDDNE